MKLQTIREMVNLVAKHSGTWFRIDNKAGSSGPAQIHIYGVIGWDVGANDFVQQLGEVTADAIDVHIATEGGDVFDGITILNALRSHPATITTIVDSQALSAGSFIMQAGDVRKMMPNSTVMIHRASSGAFGTDDDMEAARDLLRKATANIADVYVRRAGGTAEQWLNAMRAETWYTAHEAVAAGLADEVVELPVRAGNRRPAPPAQLPVEPANVEPTAPIDMVEEVIPDLTLIDYASLIRNALQEV